MRLLRAADRIAAPWKNGGGVTREIAAWPEGAGFDDFLWRVSMAEVAADGPFSVFPGVDRTLAVLEGRIRLEAEGRRPEELGPGDLTDFAGDRSTYGRVLDGPVLDLNLMSRRGAARARLSRVVGRLPCPLARPDGWLLALAAGDGIRLSNGVRALELEPFDAVLASAGDGPLVLEAAAPAPVYLARLELA
jgi:environmental stress-induced protein Ves